MKLKLLSSLAAIGLFATSAHAADLEPIASYGYYGSLFGGANFLDRTSVSIDPVDNVGGTGVLEVNFGRIGFDTGFVVGGAFGLEFTPGWRGELEISYRQNDVSSYYEGAGTRNLASSGDDIGALAIMANIWYDFQLSDVLGLHVGGGIGTANLDLSMANVEGGNGGDAAVNDDQWVLAGQAGVGFDWMFGNGMVASVDYRFFTTDTADFRDFDINGDPFTFSHDYTSHSIIAGLRIPFGGN